jgi:hypothetical protein
VAYVASERSKSSGWSSGGTHEHDPCRFFRRRFSGANLFTPLRKPTAQWPETGGESERRVKFLPMYDRQRNTQFHGLPFTHEQQLRTSNSL